MMMDLTKLLVKIRKGAQWPLNRVSHDVAVDLAEKAGIVAAGALAQAPVLDALLDGEKITAVVTVTVQLEVPKKKEL